MTDATTQRSLGVAVAGLGAIGQALVRALDAGMPRLHLAAVSARNQDRAGAIAALCKGAVRVLPIGALGEAADVVVECLPAAAFAAVAEPALRAGRILIVASCGALLDHPDLPALAARHGGRIVVPTGALIGLDAMQAAAEGVIHSVRMVTRKPPKGLTGAPYLVENGIDLAGLAEPVLVFSGTAREAVRGFPANVNVAAALSLAGIGPDRTMIEIWADPALSRNTHSITVDSDSAQFSMSISNIPSENPKTGRITALSVIAALRKLTSVVATGT
jgi:aspartate dehydrogenase